MKLQRVGEMEKSKKELQERLEEVNNQLKRSLADYSNLERRVKEEKDSFVKFANQNLLLKLLPLFSSLEFATKKSGDEGIALILKQFGDLFKSEGLEEIYPRNEKFDPSIHEAVEVVAGKKGTVVEVLESGFKIHDKLLRAAKVKVGSGDKKRTV